MLVFLASLQGLLSAQARSTTEEADLLGVRGDLHFPLHARATNLDGSLPIYKNPNASIEDRVNDLLPRMTLQEKVAQLYVFAMSLEARCCPAHEYNVCRSQGDLDGWMNLTDPNDDTKAYNASGLVRTSNFQRCRDLTGKHLRR